MATPTVVTPPVTEPVSVWEAKQHLRVDGGQDDALIGSLIVAARDYCERIQGRAYLTQTLRIRLDGFPRIIELPRPPLVTVASITYIDGSGVLQTLASDLYRVDDSTPARITPAYGTSWPSTQRVTNSVTVTYTAGHGHAATSAPPYARQAILLLVGHWYSERSGVSVGMITKTLEFALDSLLAADRVF